MPSLRSIRAVPWALLLQAGAVANEHWRALGEKDRRRLTQLLRDSRGMPGNLTSREREELKALMGKLDIRGMGRDLVPLAGALRRRR